MKVQRSLILIGVILVIFSLQVTGYIEPIIKAINGSPWWVYLVFAGILFSGFQFFRISREEDVIDQTWIEQEGKVYIERMEKEREARKSKSMG